MAFVINDMLNYGQVVELVTIYATTRGLDVAGELHRRLLDMRRVTTRHRAAVEVLLALAKDQGEAAEAKRRTFELKRIRLEGMWQQGCMAIEVEPVIDVDGLGFQLRGEAGEPAGEVIRL